MLTGAKIKATELKLFDQVVRQLASHNEHLRIELHEIT